MARTLISLLCAGLLCAGCAWDATLSKISQKTNVDFSDVSDVHIYNFTTDFFKLKKKQWELVAEDAYLYSKQNRFALNKLAITHFDKDNKVVSRVVSDYGEFDNKSKNIVLRTNVIIISSNKTTATGDYFFWDNARELITSDQPVTVVRPGGDVIRGSGMVADRRLESISFDNPTGTVQSVGE